MFLLGSCWAFSAVGAIEGINAITTGKLINLSEQELLDCDPISGGCNSGWVNKAFDWVIRNKGVALENDYPYRAEKGVCKASQVLNFYQILYSFQISYNFLVLYINFLIS